MTLKEFIITVLSLITVLLFGLNYPIAEFLAPWDIDPDKNLSIRFNIYAMVMVFCFILTMAKLSPWCKFILSIGIGICVSDVLDRFVFDVTIFQWNDIVMLVLTILLSYKKHIYASKNSANT